MTSPRHLVPRIAIGLVVALLAAIASFVPADRVTAAEAPDIIVIVTDDQRVDTLRYMRRTRGWLPTRFDNAIVSNAACCPSRTAMFTGTYSHTNGVWTNGGGRSGSTRRVYGGWRRYDDLGLDRWSIAWALQQAGYRTGHFGKFLNLFRPGSLDDVPIGWTEFHALANGPRFDKGLASPYYEYSLAGLGPRGYTVQAYGDDPADHSTRVLTNEAVDFIASTGDDEPLFLHVAYPAPHARSRGRVPIPLPQDEDTAIALPRLDANVNERDVSDKPVWIRRGDRIGTNEIDRWRVAVARSLLGVDRGIDRILRAQSQRDPGLDNTFVLFVSDNGRLHGEHRWTGKSIAYEEAIRVPMLARWPGLPAGRLDRLVANLDVAATIADVAGVASPSREAISFVSDRRRVMVIEGVGGEKGYCGIRTETRKYVRYGSGDVEYYNLERDPLELENRPDAPAAKELRTTARALCLRNLPPDWPNGDDY